MVLFRDNDGLVSVERASELIHDIVLWYFQIWNKISFSSKRITTRKPKKENVSVKGKWLTEAITWRGKEKMHNTIPLAIFFIAIIY